MGTGEWLYFFNGWIWCECGEKLSAWSIPLHPDYRNVTANAKCSKLENFFLSFCCSIAPIFSLSLSLSLSLSVSLYYDAKTRREGGFFSDFSPPRAWQFSFEGGTLRRIIFSLNIAKYAGNEEVTSLRTLSSDP